jgi:glycosyltransferase involved in cell wall biosynthesis
LSKQKLLIDWPLTPYTGWGSYGIQLAKALLASGLARPVLTNRADRSPHCDLAWLMRLDELERYSARLIEYARANPTALVETNCRVVLEPMGNLVPPQRMQGAHQVGVAFIERTTLDKRYREDLERFDLVITGAAWNQRLLEQVGYDRSVLIHQGVDACHFHPVPVPRLLRSSFVLFAGGKLEARKGQDVVIAAFKRLLTQCPDALLIACWGNIGNVGLDTIALSPHVEGSPSNGDAESLYSWLLAQGLPQRNILVPSITANAQLAPLIKQADAAVFTSRCEGGTNLMAMETLACGIPTVLSANTGHLDLLHLDLPHALPVGEQGLGQVPAPITAGYGGDAGGLWGETDPEELLETLLRIRAKPQHWRQRGQQGAGRLQPFSWTHSMEQLLKCLLERGLLCAEGTPR